MVCHMAVVGKTIPEEYGYAVETHITAFVRGQDR